MATLAFAGFFTSCSSLPTPKYTPYQFPKADVYVTEIPKRKFTKLGQVRTKVDYNSMNPEREDQELCKNYYNKAAQDILKQAKRDAKADAVIELRVVTFYLDGSTKLYTTPECSDDGGEGQVLLQGIAIQWVKEPPKEVKP